MKLNHLKALILLGGCQTTTLEKSKDTSVAEQKGKAAQLDDTALHTRFGRREGRRGNNCLPLLASEEEARHSVLFTELHMHYEPSCPVGARLLASQQRTRGGYVLHVNRMLIKSQRRLARLHQPSRLYELSSRANAKYNHTSAKGFPRLCKQMVEARPYTIWASSSVVMAWPQYEGRTWYCKQVTSVLLRESAIAKCSTFRPTTPEKSQPPSRRPSCQDQMPVMSPLPRTEGKEVSGEKSHFLELLQTPKRNKNKETLIRHMQRNEKVYSQPKEAKSRRP